MSITNRLNLTKVVAGLIAVAMIVGVLFSFAPSAKAVTLSELVELFISLGIIPADKADAARSALASSGGSTTGGGSSASVCPFTWTRNLSSGATGDDVMKLQVFLNANAGTQVAASGAGSPGNETSYYGPATGGAVKKFQEMYASEVLTPVGLTSGTFFFGPSTRAKANALCVSSGGTTTGGTTGGTTTGGTTGATGTGLNVSAGAQPANSLAVANAARVPFTKFMVTAGSDGAVNLNSVTVERKGLGANSAFAGIVLLDENGNQLGNSKTLNSDNKATVGSTVTIPAGTSKMFTIAGNMGALTSLSGQQVSLDVVAVNTSATVSGVLPIMGATHTLNNTLTIGTVTMANGSLNPASNQTKEVGTTGYNFTSIKITAGSAEDVYLKQIRFEQTGSVSQSDLANVVVVIDGTSYPTTVTDGRYYTATFPGSGLLISKGFNKDVTLKGDIVSGSDRTISFDIAKRTDVYLVGKTYGYGITPPLAGSAATANSGAFNNQDDQYYEAHLVTVNTGTAVVSVWTSVTAQNIAINQNDQPLGGFTVDIKGEPVTVTAINFDLANSNGTTATNDLISNVTLVDQNGSVLAGPIDASAAFTNALAFTDSITFPIGVTNVTIKGKLDSTWSNNVTVQASTTPSSDWTGTGDTTGKTVSFTPSSAITSSLMTGKSASLTITVDSVPIAQNVIAGAQDFLFANYILDGTASGEDLRITSLPLAYGVTGGGSANDLTGCQLWDGATALTTGGNIKDPTAVSSSTAFTLDGSGLIVAKGTSKTVGLSCDIRSGASGTYLWGIDVAATFSGISGVTSGTSVTSPVSADQNGQAMSATTGGSLAVALDASSPSAKVVSAGATGVELARFKVSATGEAVNLAQLGLQMANATIPGSLVGRKVNLYTTDNTMVGSAVFPSGATATATISGFNVPKNGSKVLVVKGDLAGISASGPRTASGDAVAVNYDGDNVSSTGANGTYGLGVDSGAKVAPTTAVSPDTAVATTKVYKTYPVFTTSGGGVALDGGVNNLMTVNITGVGGELAVHKLTFSVATSSATLSAPSFTGPNGSVGSAILSADGTTITVLFDSTTNTADKLVSTSGKNYTLKATVDYTGTNDAGSVSVALKADDGFITATPLAVGSGASSTENGVWSPISTTTSSGANNLDWFGLYGLGGCFTNGLGSDCDARSTSN